MAPRSKFPLAVPLALGLACAPASAQQLIGYISTRDASVTGASDLLDDRAVLSGSVSIAARDHTAPLTLARGGKVNVCQTSILHVTESRAVTLSAPLLFSLDRGALEITMKSTPNDAIMTPDLRFTIRNSGPLDLHLRIARNGDTCVENRGVGAPTLSATDPFGESMYEIAPNQHVLFEHGSLHEVVDHESVPCGCPEPKGMSLADALIAPGAKGGSKPVPTAAAQAPAGIEQHPFPAAISEGLAPAEEVKPMPANGEQLQISGALVYDASKDANHRNGVMKDPNELTPNSPQPATPAPAVKPPPVQTAAVAPPPPPPPVAAAPAPKPHRDFGHAVGHFFRRLFGGH